MEAKMSNGSLSAMDPYCIPENVGESIASFLRYKKKVAREGVIESFVIKPYRHRREPFGITIHTGKSRAFLSDAGFKILQQFEVDAPYTFYDKRIHWGSIEPVGFIRGLTQRGVAVTR